MKKKLFYHLKRGKLMFIGKPVFVTLVSLELWWEFLMDKLFDAKKESSLVDTHLTIVIKTFERPEELSRLIFSIKRFYPNIHIIVVDDSRHPAALEGVEMIVLPYDSGISAGRNEALKHVKTRYVLLLDDDFVFYRKTDLDDPVALMERHGSIDIMGGAVVNLPLYSVHDYRRSALFPGAKTRTDSTRTDIGGMPVYDKVANFFVARSERLQQVGWDENLKKLEHNDFFTRAKGVLTTVYNPRYKVLHAQTPFKQEYMKKRDDVSQEREYLYQKYYRHL